jgi:2-oxoglutarate ferredoxin oxidoreductase subunit beta
MKALANTGNDPDNTFVVAGIGCSGKIGTYMHSYALHCVHGRTLPVDIGTKLASPNLEVMVAGDDGDGYSTGAGHFVHAVRRNLDVSYVVMDSPIHGLTNGRASPTSREDFETSTTPDGSKQPPVNPLALALAAGGTFIAQSFRDSVVDLQENDHDPTDYDDARDAILSRSHRQPHELIQ